MSPRIFFSVGEPSGDLHAAKLIRSIRDQNATAEFCGFGGDRMKEVGCNVIYPLTELAVVGFVEVLPKLREFFRVADMASDCFQKSKPDAVVLVDFPGFNWHIAKRAKQYGIPVFYYLPPQLWAWGQWRVKKMRRTVDHVLCNLPFEQTWFEQHGVRSHYVGHPFFDEVHERVLDSKFLSRWLDSSKIQVAVLPGSRSREVKNIWPLQLEVIRRLARKHPNARFHVAALKDAHCLWCRQQLQAQDRDLDINFFVGKTSEVIQIADCALAKSGSVSLELMARTVPTVIVYHVGRIMYQIAKRLTSLRSITLPNMLAGRLVMSEFLAVGSDNTAMESSLQALDKLLSDADERARQRADLLELKNQYAVVGASTRAAAKIIELLNASPTSQAKVA